MGEANVYSKAVDVGREDGRIAALIALLVGLDVPEEVLYKTDKVTLEYSVDTNHFHVYIVPVKDRVE